MPCGKGTMKWKRAMSIARKNYPKLGLSRRKRIAAAITKKKKTKRKKK